MYCDRCGAKIDPEHAHVVYHLKIVCDDCYREMLSRVVSIEEWFFNHDGIEEKEVLPKISKS